MFRFRAILVLVGSAFVPRMQCYLTSRLRFDHPIGAALANLRPQLASWKQCTENLYGGDNKTFWLNCDCAPIHDQPTNVW